MTRTWIGFSMMCVGMFMAILDVQVVATSLPALQSALQIAPDQMSWVQTAYLIAEVIAIALTGFLMRMLGMRRLFVVATSIFTIASVGCAASNSLAALISWRVVQGFANGTLIPSVFSAVFLLFPVARQGVATMLAGVLAVLAPTIGPIVGGWITETYSWHWLFLIHLLPGVVSTAVAAFLLPKSPMRLQDARTLDFSSLALMAIALAALVANTALVNFVTSFRLVYGMARQGLLPQALGNVHQRSRTPHLAAIMLLALGMFGSIANLASASVLLLLAVFAVVNGALFILKGRRSEPTGRFEIPRWVPAAGTVICLAMVGIRVSSSDWHASALAGGLLAGIPSLYALLRPKSV